MSLELREVTEEEKQKPRGRRKALGKTMGDVARKMGWPVSTVSDLETDHTARLGFHRWCALMERYKRQLDEWEHES